MHGWLAEAMVTMSISIIHATYVLGAQINK